MTPRTNLEQLRGHSGTMLSGMRFNLDQTRLCMPTTNGIACYRGMQNENGEWNGTLDGIAKDEQTADRFLEGAYVDLLPVN